MKIKTSELIDQALDYAVAACLWPEQIHKYPAWWFDQHPDGCYLWEALDGEDSSVASFSPQMRWAQGGPIIEREGINTFKYNKLDASEHDKWGAHKVVPRKAMDGVEYSAALCLDGPTPLIAAMRCYVASKLGDEVDIPEELV